jgi:hypothetical protein
MAFNPELLVIWATAIATLGVYTILYRENPVSRLFEHIFVGMSVGYWLAITWTETLLPKWWTPMVSQGQWYWCFALVPGVLFYFIYSRRLSWLARLAMGLFFGTQAGQFFRAFFPMYWPQVTASFKPLRPAGGVGWADTILHNWLFVVVLLTVMSYFFFSVPHESKSGKVLGRSAGLGRWFLMVAFGAMFGNTVMARMSLLIGKVQYLLQTWIGHYWPWLAHRML